MTQSHPNHPTTVERVKAVRVGFSLDWWSVIAVVTLALNLSRRAFLPTFAGVGLRTNVVELRRQCVRPFIVGALAGLSVAAATLVLVLAVDTLIGL
jgi:uncharacterized membrane protein YadS